MAYNIYLGNLPEWVTADDIRSWLHSSDLVCDEVRVIRDFETQQSKGYAFVEAPNEEEMESIIRRFNRAPIDGKSQGLALTADGEARLAAARAIIEGFEAELIARVPEEHRAHLLPALEALWR